MNKNFDIIIVGSGPAGLTSAIYASRANKSVLVIEKEAFGGMITHSPKVENYPGYESISGLDLADKFVAQAMALGVMFEFDEVKGIEKSIEGFLVKCENNEFIAKSVIIASGSKHRKLNLDNEDKLTGKGISYCAVCDGAFYMGQEVVIIGGGNSAMQEAILLSSYCPKVTMIQNLPYLTGEDSLVKAINKNEKINVIYNHIVVELLGEDSLKGIVLQNVDTKENTVFDTNSVFVCIGQVSDNEPFKNVCLLNNQGFIISDELCSTNVEGIFVAGDCKDKKIRQIVTATSDGSIAALQAIKYIDKK